MDATGSEQTSLERVCIYMQMIFVVYLETVCCIARNIRSTYLHHPLPTLTCQTLESHHSSLTSIPSKKPKIIHHGPHLHRSNNGL